MKCPLSVKSCQEFFIVSIMCVYNFLFGSFFLIALVCGNDLGETEKLQLVGEDYGSAEIQRILDDPNFDIENMTVRITSNGEIHKMHLQPVSCKEKEGDKLGVIPKKKIIGGKTANAGSIPYIVSLYEHGIQNCGGSIFNKDYVVSAAHCFHDGTKQESDETVQSKWELIAGDHTVSITEPNEQKRKIMKVIIHPKYNSRKSTYDIALLKVDKPFVYDHFVQPIPIGNPPPKPAGEVWVSGWGYTKVRQVGGGPTNDYYYADKLQTTNIDYVSDSTCKQMYASYSQAQRFIESGTLFCAGIPEGGKDACQADSGGPLVCLDRDPNSKRSKTQKWLCGVVSTGFGCGLPNHPGFYTKISNTEVKEWINQVAGWADRPTRYY